MNQVVFQQVILLFIPVIIGFVLRKRNMVDSAFTKSLSDFIFVFLLPCMVLDAMKFEFSVQVLINSGWLVLISSFTLFVLWVIGWLLSKKMDKHFDAQAVIEFSITCSNFGFMGFPIAYALFGQEGLFYASIQNIPYYIFSNSIALFLINRKNSHLRLRDLWITPPTVAVVLGLIRFLGNIPLPGVVDQTIATFSSCTSPISMVLIGLVLADSDLSRLFRDGRIYIISVIRLLVAPLGFFFLGKACGLTGFLLDIPTVILSMPVAAQIILLSKRYDKDAGFAAQIVGMSTLLSIFTISIVAAVIQYF